MGAHPEVPCCDCHEEVRPTPTCGCEIQPPCASWGFKCYTPKDYQSAWACCGQVGSKSIGLGSYINLTMTLDASWYRTSVYRCASGGAIADPGLYGATVPACELDPPTGPTANEILVAWHATKRVLRVVDLQIPYCSFDPECETGWAFQLITNLELLEESPAIESGPTDSVECGETTIFKECGGTQIVQCLITVEQVTLFGVLGIRITIVPTASLAWPFNVPLVPAPVDPTTYQLAAGGSWTTPGGVTGRLDVTLTRAEAGLASIVIDISGSQFEQWHGYTVAGDAVAGAETSAGITLGTVAPAAPAGLVPYTTIGAATSVAQVARCQFLAGLSLETNTNCVLVCPTCFKIGDCPEPGILPDFCHLPTVFAIEIVWPWHGEQCPEIIPTTYGVVGQCILTGELTICPVVDGETPRATIRWSSIRSEIVAGAFAPGEEPNIDCDALAESLEEFTTHLHCQRDPDDLVDGECGWVVSLNYGGLTLVCFIPLSAANGLPLLSCSEEVGYLVSEGCEDIGSPYTLSKGVSIA